jgi:hypothetical protein
MPACIDRRLSEIDFIMRQWLIPLVVLGLVAGCTSIDSKSVIKDEKEFVTGSNIPRKDPSKDEVTVLPREALDGLQRSSGGPTTRGSEKR